MTPTSAAVSVTVNKRGRDGESEGKRKREGKRNGERRIEYKIPRAKQRGHKQN